MPSLIPLRWCTQPHIPAQKARLWKGLCRRARTPPPFLGSIAPYHHPLCPVFLSPDRPPCSASRPILHNAQSTLGKAEKWTLASPSLPTFLLRHSSLGKNLKYFLSNPAAHSSLTLSLAATFVFQFWKTRCCLLLRSS